MTRNETENALVRREHERSWEPAFLGVMDIILKRLGEGETQVFLLVPRAAFSV